MKKLILFLQTVILATLTTISNGFGDGQLALTQCDLNRNLPTDDYTSVSTFLQIYPDLELQCTGFIDEWIIFNTAHVTSSVYVSVWQKLQTGKNIYRRVGVNRIQPSGPGWQVYKVPREHRIPARPGYVIGFYYDSYQLAHMRAVIPHATSLTRTKGTHEYVQREKNDPIMYRVHPLPMGRFEIDREMTAKTFIDIDEIAPRSAASWERRNPAIIARVNGVSSDRDPMDRLGDGNTFGLGAPIPVERETTAQPWWAETTRPPFRPPQAPAQPPSPPVPASLPMCRGTWEANVCCNDRSKDQGSSGGCGAAATDQQVQWTYDHQSRRCQMFVYLGCRATSYNRFTTRLDCQRTCERQTFSPNPPMPIGQPPPPPTSFIWAPQPAPVPVPQPAPPPPMNFSPPETFFFVPPPPPPPQPAPNTEEFIFGGSFVSS